MKKLCIYHANCADGFASATVVRYSLGKENTDFHPGVYYAAPPDVSGRDVILVDFSYKRDVLIEMAKAANTITILDHHKTAKNNLVELPENVETVFDMERSGAVITWNYYNPGTPVPMFLQYIQDRDLWRFDLKGSREIMAAIFSYPYDFDLWEDFMFSDPYDRFYSDGVAIERKHFKDIREYIDAAVYRTTIAGYDVPVLNAPYFWSSDAGHILAKNEPFAACYWDTPDGRVFSLRSSKTGVDVSKVAELFGGGGHAPAAGFTLPFDKLDTLAKKSVKHEPQAGL